MIQESLIGGEDRTIFSFLWSVIRPYRWWYVLMLQAPIIGAFYQVVNAFLLKFIIDSFGDDAEVGNTDLLLPILFYIGALLVHELAWRISHFAWMKSQPFVRADIVTRCYDYIQGHSYSFFQNTYAGSIASKVRGMVMGYDTFWAGVHHRLMMPLLLILVSVIAFGFINLQLFIFMVLWCAMFFSIMLKRSFQLGKLATQTSNSEHQAIGLIADNIANITNIFSFASGSRELKRIKVFSCTEVAQKDYNEVKYDLISATFGGVLYVVMLFSLLVFMVYLRRVHVITIGDFVFVMTMAFFLVDNLWLLVSQVGGFMREMGDFKSSFTIFQTPQSTIDKPDAIELKVSKGEILFKDISFQYEDGGRVFQNLNLPIKPGEKVGLVGHSGAGKSTLISLLLKNFKVDSGEIIIDGQCIDDATSDSVRSQISLIPQDVMLFHRSITENIGYAKENATQLEIEEAAKLADIHEFILGLPAGYNTLVGERGVKLSGGERQRIAIARAVLKNAPILILDEATSSLDSLTEIEIQKSINSMFKASNVTVIAIAHRLSTIKHMDRIIVMDGGRIVEDGSFFALMKRKDGKFKALWDHQVDGMIVF